MSKIKIIPAFLPLFKSTKKYFYCFGGRGGGKSIAICDLLIALSRQEKASCLCTREVQKSIKESVYSLLKERIEEHGNTSEFHITKDEIRNKRTGFRFIFAGLKDHTVDSIKSYNVKYCWIEEAHSVTQRSLDILIPTLRKEGVRFFFSYNRKKEADPIHIRFKNEFQAPPENKKWKIKDKIYKWTEYNSDDAIGLYVNYDGNPYFPETLEKERIKLKAEDYDRYLHVWEGLPEQQGDMCVLSRQEVMDAMQRTVSDEGGYVLGCDVARFGSDRTVIFLRKGLKTIDYHIIKKSDTIQVADKIIDILQTNVKSDIKSVLLNIDDTGVGGGVTDNLMHKGYNVNPVNFGGKAVDEDKYYNVIAEMWFSFKELIYEADIPEIPELLEELTDRLYEYDNKERKKIESKDNYKKRAGKSPDMADAILLCYYNKRKEPHAWIV